MLASAYVDSIQYIWGQEWRALLKLVSVVKVTLAVDCCDETSHTHLLGFVLKFDIDKVRANCT